MSNRKQAGVAADAVADADADAKQSFDFLNKNLVSNLQRNIFPNWPLKSKLSSNKVSPKNEAVSVADGATNPR